MKWLFKSNEEIYKKVTIEPVELDISKAQKIYLPKLKLERSPDPADLVKQNWDQYYSISQKAHSHYGRQWYKKAKEEWLKIYDWYHRDHRYHTYLLRTYRKLIEVAIKKKKYDDALIDINELFDKCPNYTNTDIKRYNQIASHINKFSVTTKLSLKESKIINEDDYSIESEILTIINEAKKPRGYQIKQIVGTSVLDLKSTSDYISLSVPIIEFDGTSVTYKELSDIPGIPNDTYRFRESSSQNAFLSSSKDLIIYFYNWNLELLNSFNASAYAEEHTHLRRIELSADLSYFIFTIVDQAYLLDSKMNLISVWQVPNKEGYEKRSIYENEQVNRYLNLLKLNDNPSKEEIKSAFRKLIIQWHPDKNPDNPDALETTRQLIQAYEFLSEENAQDILNDINLEEYWVDTRSTKSFEADGFKFVFEFSVGSGEDWIYGSGISDDGSRIYLGCYSGKIYQVNREGIVEKLYIIPEEKFKDYGKTNPISFIVERFNRKYILTHWYLYILKEDKTINYLRNEFGRFRWFEDGFILQGKKEITIFDNDGNKKGLISFKSSIRQVCFCDNIFLVETTTKAFTFKMN